MILPEKVKGELTMGLKLVAFKPVSVEFPPSVLIAGVDEAMHPRPREPMTGPSTAITMIPPRKTMSCFR